MPSELERRFGGLRHGDHLCMVYDDHVDQMQSASLFIRDGLAAGERCHYIADDQTVEELCAALVGAGVDVEWHRKRGALRLLTKRDVYLRSGKFDPMLVIDSLREAVENALGDGYSGFRVTGEMTWALGSEAGCERLIEYEALLNEFFPNSPSLALCQYNRKRFCPTVIRDVLRTHPVAVVGSQVCSNLFYEPPHLVLNRGDDAQRVNWMIGQLRQREEEACQRRVAEEALRQSQDHLVTELTAMNRLDDLTHRLVACHDLREALLAVLRASVALLEADGGEIQLVDSESGSPSLSIRHERVLVEDVDLDPSSANHPPGLAATGLKAWQSTPIRSRHGVPLGVLTTCFRAPHRPSDRQYRILDLYVRQAADLIERMGLEAEGRQRETEINRLNQELRSRVDDLQAVLDIVPVGVGISHDPACRTIVHNPYVSRLLGVPPWQNGSLSVPPEERPDYRVFRNGSELAPEELPMQIAGTGLEVTNLELELRRPGVDPVTLVCHARPLLDLDGQVRGSVGALLDITERKKTEEAVRHQNHRLRLLSEAAAHLLTSEDPDALMRGLFAKIAPEFGLDAYFHFAVSENDDALHLASCIGISDDKLDSVRQLKFGQGICGAVAQTRIPMVAAHIQQSDDLRVQHLRSLGIRAYACNPLLAGETLLGTLSFASRTKDQFQEDELGFLRTVSHYATLAGERLKLIRRLRDADRRKDEFLAMLAHELRNPLTPIRSGLDLIAMTHAGDAETIAVMREQVEHLVRMIDDLLDVSRIMRGKIQLNQEPVEVAGLLRNAVRTARPLFEAQNHELHVSLPADSQWVFGDRVRLTQAVSNLLNNAAKYTEKRGSIWLTVSPAADNVRISIRDDGIGIDPHLLPHVFDLFTQADRSLERSQGGLGIGLTVVRSLVEMHGGTVTGRSDGVGRETSSKSPSLSSNAPTRVLRNTPRLQPKGAAAFSWSTTTWERRSSCPGCSRRSVPIR